MIPTSGRFSKTAVELMSKMLQIFTLSYIDSQRKGPKVLVLFTDFSKNETDDGESFEDSFDTDGEKDDNP